MIEILNGIRETVNYKSSSSFRIYRNDENENYPVHWHTALEIIMPLVNGYEVHIENSTYVLNPDDILLIANGELHSLYSPESGIRIILQLDISMLYNLKGFETLLPLLHPCMLITPGQDPDIHPKLKTIINEIVDEYFTETPLYEASIYSKLLTFFVTLGRSCISDERKFPNIKHNKHQEYIEKFLTVCTYINEHCTEDISVDELAGIAGFSKFHFARLFKQFTNTSYYDYLNKQRIAHAEKLLMDPDCSITEAAMQSGFNSLSTFNRIFKSLKSCTPSSYKSLYGSTGSSIPDI